MNGHLEGALSGAELRSQRSIADLAVFPDEQPFQSLELSFLALSNGFAPQLILHATEDGQRPLTFEDPVRRQVGAGLETVPPLGGKDVVEWQQRSSATSRQRAGSITFVGEVVLERAEQERSEAPALAVEVVQV